VPPHFGQRSQSQADRCDRDISHQRKPSPRRIMSTGLVTFSGFCTTTEWSLGPRKSEGPVATLHHQKVEPSPTACTSYQREYNKATGDPRLLGTAMALKHLARLSFTPEACGDGSPCRMRLMRPSYPPGAGATRALAQQSKARVVPWVYPSRRQAVFLPVRCISFGGHLWGCTCGRCARFAV